MIPVNEFVYRLKNVQATFATKQVHLVARLRDRSLVGRCQGARKDYRGVL